MASIAAISPVNLLRDNIGGLIHERRLNQKDLAFWCGHSEAWISAFLREERALPLKDLGRIADFFGLDLYQLFQPGISRATERRRGERRLIKDRRVSHDQRVLQQTAAEINRVRPGPATRGFNAKINPDERRLIEHLRAHPDEKPGVFKSLELHADLQKPKPAAAKPDIGKRKRS